MKKQTFRSPAFAEPFFDFTANPEKWGDASVTLRRISLVYSCNAKIKLPGNFCTQLQRGISDHYLKKLLRNKHGNSHFDNIR